MRIEEVTEETIRQLHINQADTARLRKYHYLELTWYHSLIVGKIALQLADSYQNRTGVEFDRELIKLGSLAHDIGSYICFDQDLNYAIHGFRGRQILLKENFPVELAEIASSHTGLAAWDVDGLNLNIPARHYLPRTLEEKLVFYADNLHIKSTHEPRFVSGWKHVENRVQAWDKASARRRLDLLRDEFGVPDLSILKKRYQAWHEKMTSHYTALSFDLI